MVFQDMGKLAIVAVTVGIVLVVGFLIMASVRTQADATDTSHDFTNATECAQSSVCNATDDTVDAIATIPGWIGLVILVSIGALLVGLVKKFG